MSPHRTNALEAVYGDGWDREPLRAACKGKIDLPHAVAVLIYHASWANRSGQSSASAPSISRALSLSESTVERAQRALAESGVLVPVGWSEGHRMRQVLPAPARVSGDGAGDAPLPSIVTDADSLTSASSGGTQAGPVPSTLTDPADLGPAPLPSAFRQRSVNSRSVVTANPMPMPKPVLGPVDLSQSVSPLVTGDDGEPLTDLTDGTQPTDDMRATINAGLPDRLRLGDSAPVRVALGRLADRGWTAAEVGAALDQRHSLAAMHSGGAVVAAIEQLGTEAPPARPPARPAWCGQCDETTRLVALSDGRVMRCPDCHPLAAPDRPAP